MHKYIFFQVITITLAVKCKYNYYGIFNACCAAITLKERFITYYRSLSKIKERTQ